MRYPTADQKSLAEAMLTIILARPFDQANEQDFGALRTLIPLLDMQQCWLVMEWVGP